MNKFTMFLCLFMVSMVTSSQTNHNERKVYIVFTEPSPPERDEATIISYHQSLVRSVTGKSYTPSLIRLDYGKTFEGFAALLTEESKKLSALPDILAVEPNTIYQLHDDVDVINDNGIDSRLKPQHLAPF